VGSSLHRALFRNLGGVGVPLLGLLREKESAYLGSNIQKQGRKTAMQKLQMNIITMHRV